MNEHAIGFVTGLVLAILVVGMVKRILYKRNGKMPEYDEMQKIAQGMAYKYGFFDSSVCCGGLLGIRYLKYSFFCR